MTAQSNHQTGHHGDTAPGDEGEDGTNIFKGLASYALGLLLAAALTAASFWALQTHLIYGPGIPFALVALAVAQMGVHLVFFLHLTSAPDNTNTILALAFGVMIVCLLVFGSLWIMSHLNHNMMPMTDLMNMRR